MLARWEDLGGINRADLNIHLEEVVDEIWTALGRRTSRERVQRVASEVASKFSDARVTGFVSIFIRRLSHERLAREIQITEEGKSRELLPSEE